MNHPNDKVGNVTSQLFANIYLHKLDTFIKQPLREKYYLRYCDDFLLLSNSENHLLSLISPICNFLMKILRLEVHPKKLTIRKLSQGIDFVGYVLFDKYAQSHKKKLKKMSERDSRGLFEGEGRWHLTISLDQKLQSYLGILSHADQFSLSQALKNAYWTR